MWGFGWIRKRRERLEARTRAKWENARDAFKQMQTPLTDTERRRNWVKLGILGIATYLIILLMKLGWFEAAALFAAILVVISWAHGWDFLAGLALKYLISAKSSLDPVKDRDIMQVEGEQRLLRILVTMKTWESLDEKDRRRTALRALDTVYRTSMGLDAPPLVEMAPQAPEPAAEENHP